MSTKKERLWTNAVILSVVLACAVGTRAYEFAGGTGEPNDPYQIATAEQLIAVGADPNLWDEHFALIADIDLDPNLPGGRVFDDALIAPDESADISGHAGRGFIGVFDGQGHTIRNLHIEGTRGYDAGLFGMFSGLVKDLRLTDVRVSGSPCGAIAGLNHRGMILRCSVTGQALGAEDIGGIVGSLWDGSVVACESDVQVSGDRAVGGMVGGGPGGMLLRCESRATVTGDSDVGGLVGSSRDGEIVESRASGTVIGTNNVGGLAGKTKRSVVLRCGADCEVTAEGTAGGLIGDGWSGRHLMADSYARGSVAGSLIGGLLGKGPDLRVMNCYAACEMIALGSIEKPAVAGGLFGEIWMHRGPVALVCFWDVELSTVDSAVGDWATGEARPDLGTGLTTEQMQDEATFDQAGWDLDYVWAVPDGNYPVLRWELNEVQATAP